MSLKILNEGFNKYFKSLNEEKTEVKDELEESLKEEKSSSDNVYDWYKSKAPDDYQLDLIDKKVTFTDLAKKLKKGRDRRYYRLSSKDVGVGEYIDSAPLDDITSETIRRAGLKESRGGFVRKYKGCSIHDMGSTYVVTNEYGLNIGQSPTESGCEGIIDEYVKEKYGREPITQEFIGLPISEARQKLGRWYVLDSQNVPVGSRKATYTFKRAGYPTVVLHTLDGKVQEAHGEIYSSKDFRKKESVAMPKGKLSKKKSLGEACSKEKCKKEDEKCKEKCTDEACDKKDVKKKNLRESEASQDISEYQKWVDFDMKKYKRISDETMNKIKKAGFSVVKDQYGDYEVIADRPIKESKKKTLDDIDAIADDRKERAKKAFARVKDDADSRRDYMKKHDMKESCKRKKIRKLKESLTNSPYKALIGEQFDHTFDFDFLDVVADLLDRIDFDAEDIDEEVYSAIDEGLIYYADQWKVIQFYQTPEQANFNEAIEDLTGDLIELCNKIIESKE